MQKTPRTDQDLLPEVRKDLGFLEDGQLYASFSDLGPDSEFPSPTKSQLYPAGFEPSGHYYGLPLTRLIIDKTEDFSFKVYANWDNLVVSSTDVSDEDEILANFALKCKRKKKMDNYMKKKDSDKAKFERKTKTSGSNVSIREGNTNQIFLGTKPGRASEHVDSESAEEAKHIWELGECLSLYASNDDVVIDALVDLYMEKKEWNEVGSC